MSSPINAVPVPDRPDEIAVDAAYAAVNAALKQWRRSPDSAETKAVLIAAFDAREDALVKTVDEDLRLEAEAVSQVQTRSE